MESELIDGKDETGSLEAGWPEPSCDEEGCDDGRRGRELLFVGVGLVLGILDDGVAKKLSLLLYSIAVTHAYGFAALS